MATETKALPLAAFLQKGTGSLDYRTSTVYGIHSYHYGVQEGEFSWYDIPKMRRDPQVRLCFKTIKGPLQGVKWNIKATDQNVAATVDKVLKKFWQADLDKALKMVEWGSAACGVEYNYDEDTGRIEYAGLKEFSLYDAIPLVNHGKMVGLRVSGLRDHPTGRIGKPQYIWWANEPEFGLFYGRSRYAGAWAPWMEKRGKKGACDGRRLWFEKYAYGGGQMSHPLGSIETETGTVSNSDYAREIVEKSETGNVTTMPSTRDEKGNLLWEFKPASINGDGTQFIEYPKSLDIEIAQGMEIHPEVIQAALVGSGWSGRSVPLLLFLVGEDSLANSIMTAFVEHVVKPLVAFNHGEGAKFEVEVESLVPKDEPAGQPGPGGQPPGAGGPSAPGQGQEQPPQGQGQGGEGIGATNNPQQIMGAAGAGAGGKPVGMSSYDEAIEAAAAQVDTEPTDEQKAAGNYRKGHVTIQGLPITLENPKGSTRKGVSKSGKAWSIKMHDHYGYIKKTESDADGDHVDVFVGPCPESEVVFVVNQKNADGEFDEHKCMIGYVNADEAKDAYLANYSKGWTGFGGLATMTMDQFKEWIASGDTGNPVAMSISLSAERAPSGYTKEKPLWIQGQPFTGGEWIPATVIASATAAEKQAIGIGGDAGSAGTAGAAGKTPKAKRTPRVIVGTVPYRKEGAYWVNEQNPDYRAAGGLMDKWRARGLVKDLKDEPNAPGSRTMKEEVTHGDSDKRLEKAGEGNLGDRGLHRGESPDAVRPDAQGKPTEPGQGTGSGRGLPSVSDGQDVGHAGTNFEPDRTGNAAADSQGTGDGRSDGNGAEPRRIRVDGVDVYRQEGDEWVNEKNPQYRISESGMARWVKKGRAANISEATAENPVDSAGGTNFKYNSRDFHKGTLKEKFNANLDAIRTLQAIKAEGRSTATVEEQEILSKYLGWGQFPNVFKERGEEGFSWDEKQKWQKEANALRGILTDEEWESARASALNAHYTDPSIVDAHWKMAKRLGFKGGKFLETSAGIGYYLGMMPDELAGKTKSSAVEIDSLTGDMLQLLYPKAIVKTQGFEEHQAPDNFYDLVASNVPFGDYGVHDPRYNKFNAPIHDYFFLKSADLARPGGLIMHITSTGTMDKGETAIRQKLAEDCDLVSAIRFPGHAHQEGAGTAVVTDMLILRKRQPGEKPVSLTETPDEAKPQGEGFTGTTTDALGRLYHWKDGKRVPGNDWMDVVMVPDPDGGEPIPVNKYFADHPEQILGRLDRTGTMRGADQKNVSLISPEELSAKLGREVKWVKRDEADEATSAANKHGSFLFEDGTRVPAEDIDRISREVYAQKLEAAINRLPANLMKESQSHKESFEPQRLPAPHDVLEGGFTVQDGKLYVREGGSLIEQPDVSKAKLELIQAHLNVLAAMRGVINADTRGEPADEARTHLNNTYDAFVEKYGPLHDRKNLLAFRADVENSPVLLALEKYDPDTKTATKTDIFTKPTVRAVSPVAKAGTTAEALAVSLHENGMVDVEHMARLTGKSVMETAHELTSSGLAFRDPGEGWKPADQYLSGNVRRKLALAITAAEADPTYHANVEALKKVQPEDIHHTEIEVRLGAPWIPKSDIVAFAAELVSGRPDNFDIGYVEATGNWSAAWGSETARKQSRSSELVQKWSLVDEHGETHKTFVELLDAALNNTAAIVRGGWDEEMRDGQMVKFPAVNLEGKNVVNKKLTSDAAAKVQEIKDAFGNWLWSDDDRRERLHRYYNDNFNNIVPMRYDGSHQKFPGMNLAKELHPHIPDFVWQVVTTGRGLAAHEVGMGKTYAMIAAAMELRRLGLAKKPAIACLKANVEAITADARLLYPGARILSTADMFTAAKRKQTLARIATGDYDLIVMTHDNLNMLQMRPETQAKYIREEIADLMAAKAKAESDAKKKGEKNDATVKNLEKARKNLEASLKKALDPNNKDTGVRFEDTGIDHLFVDEAHYYKTLPVYTAQQRVRGIPTGRSKRATAMLMRTRWLMEQNGGRGVTFATGTPVANTMAELYTMQRYLQPDELKERGLQSFDAWAKTFGDIESKPEFTVSGEYKNISRFSKFINLPELQQITGQTIDVQRVEDMNARAVARGLKAPIKRPRRHDHAMVAERTPAMDNLMKSLKERADAIKKRKGPPTKGDDNMLVVCTDGRKGAIDMRLLDKDAPDDPKSKVNLMIGNILKLAKEKPGNAQLIFSDVGVHPSKKKDKKKAEVEEEGYWGEETEAGADTAEDDDDVDEETGEAKSEEQKEREALMASTTGFHLYNDIIEKLVKGGIPREKIADFSVLKGAEKERASQGLRDGTMLVGIGSTAKLGTGVNVQDRLVALHHLDVPWLPAHIEQRDGRGVRHGNLHDDIDVFKYVSEGSLDQMFWQVVSKKDRFIKQIMKPASQAGKFRVATDEDTEALTPDQLMAAASGDERVLEKVNLDDEVRLLEAAARRHEQEQTRIKDTVRKGEKRIVGLQAEASNLAGPAKHAAENYKTGSPDFSATIGGKTYTTRKEAEEAIKNEREQTMGTWGEKKLGTVHGFDIIYNPTNQSHKIVAPSGDEVYTGHTLQGMEYIIRNLEQSHQRKVAEVEKAKADLEKVRAEIGKKFQHGEALEAKRARLAELEKELAGMANEKEKPTPTPTPTPTPKKESESVAMSAERAPTGYTHTKPLRIGGHDYVGGQWIPSNVVANATASERAAIGGKASATPSAAAAPAPSTPPPSDREQKYVTHAMENLRKTSRTASGTVDTSASAGKAEKMAEGLTGDKAAQLATHNYEQVIRDLHNVHPAQLDTPEKVGALADQVNRAINKGITKAGVLLRTDDSPKYPYTAAKNLHLARQQFAEEFHRRLNDPDADPIETAAWVEWRVNMTDHAYADGVGKTGKALAAMALMHAGLPLPTYGDTKEFYEYSQKHPFDPHRGGATYLNDEYKRFVRFFKTKVPTFAAHTVRRVEKDYPPSHPDKLDSFERHGGSQSGPSQITPQRKKLHDKIISTVTNGIPAAQGEKIYTLMGGGPASGKSSVIKTGQVKLPDNHVMIDSDAIKGQLPEYEGLIEEGFIGDKANPETGHFGSASYVHEESSYLAKEIQTKGFGDGQHVVMDGTGDNSVASVMKKVKQARAAGYKVHANYVTCSTKEALRRNYLRAYGYEKTKAAGLQVHPHEEYVTEKQPDGKVVKKKNEGTGRLPPEDMARTVHRGVSIVLPQLVEQGAFDHIQLWDTEVPPGQPPVLVMSAQGKNFKVHHQEKWKSFLAKQQEPLPTPPAG